jgi:uncharacterized OB-fold protein
VATWTLQFPYRRSTGPVIGAFLAALGEHRILGCRTHGGRVLCPPLEYDPETGEETVGLVEVGPEGLVEHSSWVVEPIDGHPFDRPFAWVSVRLDGADTAIVHACDPPTPGAIAPGTRVRPRWRAEAEGKITDIECFEVVT